MEVSGKKLTALLLVLVLLLAACGQKAEAPKEEKPAEQPAQTEEKPTEQPAEKPEEKPAEAAPADTSFTVTDVSGAEYTFEKPVEHIVVQGSMSGGPFMTLAALLGDKMADAIVAMDDGPMKNRNDMWQQYLKTVPKLADIPVVGAVTKELNLEGVLTSGADVLVAPVSMKPNFDDGIREKLEAAGIPVLYINYHAEDMDLHLQSTMLLGKLFGVEERAQELNDFYVEHRGSVEKRVAEILKDRERVRLYIECVIDGPEEIGNSYPNDYMWGGIGYDCGATSIADGIIAEYGPLESEYILTQDAEKIVFTGSYWPNNPTSLRMGFEATEEQTLAGMQSVFEQRAGWTDLSAYKNGEVYAIHHGLAREMYDCAAFEFYAKVCYPEEMADLDPNATLQEYYERFLPFEFDGIWFI